MASNLLDFLGGAVDGGSKQFLTSRNKKEDLRNRLQLEEGILDMKDRREAQKAQRIQELISGGSGLPGIPGTGQGGFGSSLFRGAGQNPRRNQELKTLDRGTPSNITEDIEFSQIGGLIREQRRNIEAINQQIATATKNAALSSFAPEFSDNFKEEAKELKKEKSRVEQRIATLDKEGRKVLRDRRNKLDDTLDKINETDPDVVIPDDITQDEANDMLRAARRVDKDVKQTAATRTMALKEQLKADTNFKKTVSQFKQLVAQFKGKLEEQGGFSGFPGAALGGAAQFADKLFGGFVNIAPRSAAFPGQVTETVLALNSILTGQNRVIEGIIERIESTLISGTDTEAGAIQKIKQSLSNALRLSKALEVAGIDLGLLKSRASSGKRMLPDGRQIEQVSLTFDEKQRFNDAFNDPNLLSSKEEQEIIDLQREVLSTPAIQIGETKFSQFEQPGQQTTTADDFLSSEGF